MFYQGSLQDGIASAVAEGKAVVCFVRDDEQTSTQWEEEYFTFDEELSRLLDTRAVLLRLTQGTPEAGFLASFCPVVKFPTVVVIKNGMLCDYLVPDMSKEDFRDRLAAKLDESRVAAQQDLGGEASAGDDTIASTDAPVSAPTPVSAPVSPSPAPAPVSPPSPAAPTPPVAAPTPSQPEPTPTPIEPDQPRDASIREGKRRVEDARTSQPQSPPSKKLQQQKQPPAPKPSPKPTKQETKPQEKPSTPISITPPTPPQPPTPTQYRLQVRLFDGRSVRSSFTPTQTIRADIRPWLDSQMEEKSPYNLKHILTPLPNRTLTLTDEETPLAELGLGSSANLVMVPIQSYTEAYSATGASLPVRAVSSAYGLVSSAVGTATGLVGSFFGYGTTPAPQPAAEPASSTPAPAPASDARRQRRGPIIRTLRDQQNERDDREFYNGNQLNFQPRNDGDRR
ncbi:hypothetical protein BO78DRAFT_434576 [Aspergillus sclerotiicarbonarius CBS 121057]|uniref:UBX domain-containing protein 2 n=1 Tax=Aspergillus sclerotiicarbonarius (strain CBS 121057 / IBT 28362) TaxID=1448318 RepID=A0A319E177_ASPSB|nr:hypothetical protein BO78DRAFT_434576 [Aspergillus sclerotiicarbonarius CBS 121057]